MTPVSFWLQKIFCPSDNEKSISTSMGVSGVHGTIWSMCFISKDMSQYSEEHDPLLAVLLNRYDIAFYLLVDLLSRLSNSRFAGWK